MEVEDSSLPSSEGMVYRGERPEAVANLPTKLELITKISQSIKAVPTKVGRGISAVPNKLGRAFGALKDKIAEGQGEEGRSASRVF